MWWIIYLSCSSNKWFGSGSTWMQNCRDAALIIPVSASFLVFSPMSTVPPSANQYLSLMSYREQVAYKSSSLVPLSPGSLRPVSSCLSSPLLVFISSVCTSVRGNNALLMSQPRSILLPVLMIVSVSTCTYCPWRETTPRVLAHFCLRVLQCPRPPTL